MSILIVDRRGLTLALRDSRIELRRERELMQAVPANLVQRIVLASDTAITAPTLAGLADRKILVVALGGRAGSRVAFMTGAGAADASLRVAQAHVAATEDLALAFSRSHVSARIRSQRRLLERIAQGRPDIRKPLFDSIKSIRGIESSLMDASSRIQLRGFEGAAAAQFFSGYHSVFAPSLGFTRRRRRPPPDPVNACLSLGYTLATAEAVNACWVVGLDSGIGFYHGLAHGRPSMACDLVEPWRATVEHWVWQSFRDETLRSAHFSVKGDGLRIQKAGREHFYRAWAPVGQRLSRAMRRHARRVATAMQMAGAESLPSALWHEFEEDWT